MFSLSTAMVLDNQINNTNYKEVLKSLTGMNFTKVEPIVEPSISPPLGKMGIGMLEPQNLRSQTGNVNSFHYRHRIDHALGEDVITKQTYLIEF